MIMNHRLGSRVMRTKLRYCHVIVEVGLRPPLLIWSFHAPPPPRTRGEDTFTAAMQLLQLDLEELGGHLPQTRLAGGMELSPEHSAQPDAWMHRPPCREW